MDAFYLCFIVVTTLISFVSSSTVTKKGKGSDDGTSLLWKIDTMTSVWVVSGGRVDLPCKPQPKQKDDIPVLVLWYRSSNTLPIYSYDAREGNFSSGIKWADEVAMGGRAFFTATSKPPALVLEPARPHDEGIYTCRIDYRVSTSTTVMVNLTVVVSPGPPVVIWDGREMVGTVGPLQENELTELICRSVGGRPSPVLSWWHNGRELPLLSSNSSSDPVTRSRTVEATLSVTAKRELQGETLTCYARTPTDRNASKSAIIQPRSASVYLNITLSPVEVRILESDSVVATAGSTISVICRALGSHPPAELSWWRGDRTLEPHVTHAIDDGGNITMATLTIIVGSEDDGALITCSGTNPALPYPPLTDSTKLIIYYEPVVHLSLGKPLEAGSIKEGDDIYFECNIRANPRFHRIEWYHNGLEITQNMSAGIVISGVSLVIRELQRRHSGSYTCVATNVQGRTNSNTVHLIVRHTPICAGSGQERTQGAARGTLATATCTVEAEPSSGLKWSWVRRRTDGSEEALSKDHFTVAGLTSTLRVTPQRREDYGRLLCRATNAVGRQKEPCTVNLVPAGPPDTPTNCTAAPINPDPKIPSNDATVAVSCLEGFDGGLPQKFLLEAWQDKMVFTNLSSDFPEWVIGGVRAGTGLNLNIVGYNARGRSDPITMEVHTSNAQHRAAPDQKTSVEVQPIVGVVLGVVGVLLLLLLVGVAIARKAQTRPRKSEAEKTVAATSVSAEGFDPDVVQSIHRHPPSLDVLPQDQFSKEECDPMVTFSDEMYPAAVYSKIPPDGSEDLCDERTEDEDDAVGAQGLLQDQSFECSCRHRPFDIERQGLSCSHAQSDDSGVSESESDSELKHPSAERSASTTLFSEAEGSRIYIAVPTGSMKSPQTTSSVISAESSCGGDSGNQLPSSLTEMNMRCSSSTDLRGTADPRCKKHPGKSLEGLPLPPSKKRASFELPLKDTCQNPELIINRKPSPTGRRAASAVTSPLEVICLAVTPTSGALKSLPAEGKHKQSTGERSSIGLPVTLLEAGNGEFLLLARRTAECNKTEGNGQSTPPVYAITTLPKASGKRSRTRGVKETQNTDVSSTKKDTSVVPPIPKSTTGLDIKHVGKREFVQPAHPDVCRRESSV